jgi:hypothetical protein
MNRRYAGLGLLVFSMLGSVVCAQPVRKLDQTARFATLTSEIPQAGATDSVREVRVKWTAVAATNATTGVRTVNHTFSLVNQRLGQGPLPRERRPELSQDQLVVVETSADGTVLDWRLVQNPRIVRSEAPGPNGTLTGTVVELPDAELLLTVADVPGANRLRIYQPRWTGAEFMLDAVGDVALAP